jgi:transcriptional regulator with XRE-family HTH domain
MDGRSLVAWNLKRLRKHLNVPQERLAADAGVDRAYLSQLERKQSSAGVDLLDRLANALDVRLIEFFREPNTGERPPGSLPVGRKSRRKVQRK